MDTNTLFCRVPGLLCAAVRAQPGVPVVVVERGIVRDTNSVAENTGIGRGMPLRYARRLSPLLSVVPLEEIDTQRVSSSFYDTLSDLSPAVEPIAPDAAFADIAQTPPEQVMRYATQLLNALPEIADHPRKPVIGIGATKYAARACAECGLEAHELATAPLYWLTCDQPELTARLIRFGFHTFGDVAMMQEETLAPLLGRAEARLLIRRACATDANDRVRPLYPPEQTSVHKDYSLSPITNRQHLEAEVGTLAGEAGEGLSRGNRVARFLSFQVCQEDNDPTRLDWTTPVPLTDAFSARRAVAVLLRSWEPNAPVVSLRVVLSQIEHPTQVVIGDLLNWQQSERRSNLEQIRSLLSARYGQRVLLSLREMLKRVPAHEQRIHAARHRWEGSRS